MKSSLISIVVGLILIVAVAYFALQRSQSSGIAPEESPAVTMAEPTFTPEVSPSPATSPTVSPDAMSAEKVTVTLTDEGFVPATVTIAPGTTVTFVNNGQGLHWPASDPHPTHTGLPGLDAKHGLATGETYSFTFTKPGTFGMHDHLHTTFTATIIVR